MAHSEAQKKIGSGFDVASAVFGSCTYKRFSKEIFRPLQPRIGLDWTKRLVEIVRNDTLWDYEVNKDGKVTIPRGLRLIMCDVDHGSQTPKMVSGVSAWRDSNPEAAAVLWGKLQDANDQLTNRLKGLSEGQSDPGYAGKFPMGTRPRCTPDARLADPQNKG